MNIIIAILVLGAIIFIHELGHMIAARLCGVRVTEFSLGFGPRLFSFTAGDTKYSLKLIPLGGSCAMLGDIAPYENEDGEIVQELSPDSFPAQHPLKRAFIALAGPLFNFLLAFILGFICVSVAGVNPPVITSVDRNSRAAITSLREGDLILEIDGQKMHTGADVLLYAMTEDITTKDTIDLFIERDGKQFGMSYSPKYTRYMVGISYMNTEDPAEITAVGMDTPAAKAGLAVGDIITSVNGAPVKSGIDLQMIFTVNSVNSKPMQFTVLRAGKEYEFTAVPELISGYSLGFSAFSYREESDFAGYLEGGFQEVVYAVKSTFYSIRMLFTGQAGVEDLSGPVGIVSLIGDTVEETKEYGAEATILSILSIAILLSANLGIVNMIPLPALDGGRILFSLIELVTKKKIQPKTEGIINVATFALLMALMVFITFNDIRNLF
ncbi:MAG: RIP metalloprotease RseP [Lachnospiraceae bacterium]|nr:RIP metalloprotease RseP [Candidatus Minthocola equi]